MSFLDSLENNLKALEKQEERDPEKRKQELAEQEAERNAALRAAPYADALKTSPFTQKLLTACRTVGHSIRTFVNFTWVGTTLRLDAGPRRLELRPTENGVAGVFIENGAEAHTEVVDLDSDPDALAKAWLLSGR